jgi:hypothetical protein
LSLLAEVLVLEPMPAELLLVELALVSQLPFTSTL